MLGYLRRRLRKLEVRDATPEQEPDALLTLSPREPGPPVRGPGGDDAPPACSPGRDERRHAAPDPRGPRAGVRAHPALRADPGGAGAGVGPLPRPRRYGQPWRAFHLDT